MDGMSNMAFSLTRKIVDFTWRVLTRHIKQSANVVASCGSLGQVQVVPPPPSAFPMS